MTVRTIVLGVDGSENAARAAEWTAELAGALAAEVVAVHAGGLLAHLAPDVTVPTATHQEELRDAFEDKWCSPLRASGVRDRARLEEGPPTAVLLGVADEEHADLVVLGTRGLGGAGGLLLGSTSHHVVQLSRCPVAVVPCNRDA